MALQTRPRITRKTVDTLACELHEQLLRYREDSEIDHVFAAIIPKGIDPMQPNILNAISPTEPVLLHHDSHRCPAQKFDSRWDFLAFSMRGDVLEQLQNMQLPMGTGLIAVNMFVSDCDDHSCQEWTHRLSVVISNRHSAGVVSDGTNPPMFFHRSSGPIVEAMQYALSRASN